ncbi:acetyl-CoA acetyltransferase [Pseudoalteromonas piscicida]|uniref:acetyl-CoA acetyltransferase n=1 Tax=Pseudoalteromonas piscicida TaxID=43662 RepID=UPI0030A719BD
MLEQNKTAAIIGWGHTQFGKHHDKDLESLLIEVITEALTHAQVSGSEIDEVVLAHFNAGFSEQDFTSSLVLQHPQLPRFTPVTRVENACATGTAAVHQGARAIESGQAKTVLVVGVEKMTHLANAEVGRILGRASYVKEEQDYGSFVGVFAEIARQYQAKYGDCSEALAKIAVKNHHNGLSNPHAHLRKAVELPFCQHSSPTNPVIVAPLKRSDCSPVSDGAAAIVLKTAEECASAPRKIRLIARSQVNDYMPMSRRDMSQLSGCKEAWKQALEKAQLSIWDLDLIETHDCFTIAELMQYEAMGLAAPGKGKEALDQGTVYATGKLPVNLSGGLKSKGHPIGATGVSMHVMAAKQLANEAGEMQKPNSKRAGVFNMGGTGVANYVTILEQA